MAVIILPMNQMIATVLTGCTELDTPPNVGLSKEKVIINSRISAYITTPFSNLQTVGIHATSSL